MSSDSELLEGYTRENSQEAFTALVDRHLPLVYSAALRQVRSPELAEEIAQSVFAGLARRAARLRPQTVLAAWLHHATRCAAIDVVRRESRRQQREQIAFAETAMNSSSDEWKAIEPLLDEAMEQLGETDRAAVLLRFFEEKSLREVGAAIGSSEDAAQKRISRALEQLRGFLSKQGAVVGAGGLAVLLTAHSSSSAPVALRAAILKAAAPGLGAIATVNTIFMTTLQKSLIGATLAVAVTAGVYEASRAAALTREIAALRESVSAQAGAKISPGESPARDATRLAALEAENEKLHRDLAELARLRDKVGRLHDAAQAGSNNPASDALKSWLARVDLLHQQVKQTPGLAIPEFQYLTDNDWLNAARSPLTTSNDYRRAFSNLRSAAEGHFVSDQLQPALNQYKAGNNGDFPSDLSQLAQYFNSPGDAAMLQRWELVPQSTVPNIKVGDNIITQSAPIDVQNDMREVIGERGRGSTSGPSAWYPGVDVESLMPLIDQYAGARGGTDPTDPAQLLPYATTGAQTKTLQQLIKQGIKAPPHP